MHAKTKKEKKTERNGFRLFGETAGVSALGEFD